MNKLEKLKFQIGLRTPFCMQPHEWVLYHSKFMAVIMLLTVLCCKLMPFQTSLQKSMKAGIVLGLTSGLVFLTASLLYPVIATMANQIEERIIDGMLRLQKKTDD